MKGIFIAYDQAYNMEIADFLAELGCKGFTMWQDIAGRGSETGEPHLGNHAWPTMNNAILAFVPADKVDDILAGLGQMYVCDERFTQNIDKHGVGTAEFVNKAIFEYCK